MGIYKNWVDATTKLWGAEAHAMGQLHKLHNVPGLLPAANNYNLAKPSVSASTKVVCDAFEAGDAIVTGGAVCTEYHRNYCNLATEGAGGGPLDAGTYNIYLEIAESTGTNKYYKCYPQATADAVDETEYLKVATVVWNGTVITDLDADRGGKWGVLDLSLAIGNHALLTNEIVVGTGRDWRFTDDVQFDDSVEIVDYLKIGPEAWVNIFGGARFFAGQDFLWQIDAYSSFDAINGSFVLNLRNWSSINLEDHSFLSITGLGSMINVGALTTMLFGGEATWLDGSQLNFRESSIVKFDSGDFDGTPAKNQVVGGLVAKAWAAVNSSGTVLEAVNFESSIAHTPGTGIYVLTFKRGFPHSNYAAFANVYSADNRRAEPRDRNVTTLSVKTWDCDNDVPIDCAFTVVVFGGDQAD